MRKDKNMYKDVYIPAIIIAGIFELIFMFILLTTYTIKEILTLISVVISILLIVIAPYLMFTYKQSRNEV
jgi:uncharacterized membrane protein